MKKISNTPRTTKSQSNRPKGLELLLAFDADWPREFNGLFTDGTGNFYLADAQNVEDGEFKRDGEWLPIAEMTTDDLCPATTKEALEWYCSCIKYAPSLCGDVSPLLEKAAKLLPAETIQGN